MDENRLAGAPRYAGRFSWATGESAAPIETSFFVKLNRSRNEQIAFDDKVRSCLPCIHRKAHVSMCFTKVMMGHHVRKFQQKPPIIVNEFYIQCTHVAIDHYPIEHAEFPVRKSEHLHYLEDKIQAASPIGLSVNPLRSIV